MNQSQNEDELSKIQNQIEATKKRLDVFSLTQADHFAGVRNEIDIKRETWIDLYEKSTSSVVMSKKDLKQIQKQSAEMMKQIELAEEDFRNNFNKNLRPHLESHNQSKKTEIFLQLLEYDLRRNKFKPSNFDAKSLGKLKLYKPHFVNINDLEQEDKIQNVIVCSNDKFKIEILNMNIGCKIKQFLGHSNDVECLIRFGEEKLISASRDETIKVWSLATGECEKTLRGHRNSVKCLKLLKNGQLASGSVDTFIKIWNLNEEKCISTLSGHNYCIDCLEETPNGYIISGAWDNSIRIWNLIRNKCVKVLRRIGSEQMSSVKCLQVLHEDDLFASGFWDNSISIWNYLSGECVKTLRGHSCCVFSFELTSFNELISCSLDGTIKMWDIKGKNESHIQVLNGHRDGVISIKLVTNDKLLSLSRDNSIKLWDLDSGECLQTIKIKNQVSNLELCSVIS